MLFFMTRLSLCDAACCGQDERLTSAYPRDNQANAILLKSRQGIASDIGDAPIKR
jgi:hypothetical protein